MLSSLLLCVKDVLLLKNKGLCLSFPSQTELKVLNFIVIYLLFAGLGLFCREVACAALNMEDIDQKLLAFVAAVTLVHLRFLAKS